MNIFNEYLKNAIFDIIGNYMWHMIFKAAKR